ncbi:MAG: DNA repair protein RadA [Alphaproteobacteria bacterium]
MAKPAIRFVCQTCGTLALKWMGRCEGCEGWNTFVEETVSSSKASKSGTGRLEFASLQDTSEAPIQRWLTGCGEFDRVCGGGLVPGSVILVGGDPGIGKSTLLLQMVAALSAHVSTAYVSGEEGLDQIRLRAKRLGLGQAPVLLAAATQVSDIREALTAKSLAKVVIIDSIQTMASAQIESAPGTVSQIRACTYELIELAKSQQITVILVGHVTKEGMIAGPRVLEHMVDTVLYFEGERGHPFRLLRAVKNRFGPTDEIGVFDMTERGLEEVKNPSGLFLSFSQEAVTGSCIFPGIEGTRPVLVEIQALISTSFLPSPRRAVVGWDPQRLSMVLAVLEARCGLSFSGKDVYLNVVGGLRVSEPGADLAVACALVSCLKNEPLPRTWVAFGELGLSGEVRSVSQIDARLKEAAKLGFSRAFLPRLPQNKPLPLPPGELTPYALGHIRDLMKWFHHQGKQSHA